MMPKVDVGLLKSHHMHIGLIIGVIFYQMLGTWWKHQHSALLINYYIGIGF